jgi:hypothetical protein
MGTKWLIAAKNRKGLTTLKIAKPFILLVPGTRIELVQRFTPRDFKSLASTSSATQAFFN